MLHGSVRAGDKDDNAALREGKGLGGATRSAPFGDATVYAIRDYLKWLATKGVVLGPGDPIFRSLKTPHEPRVVTSDPADLHQLDPNLALIVV